ncbi:MAG: transcription initiation factor IIE subunit alpha [Thermoprotei archaeon]|nr:transcription initiation factor IIE subunit alpha [Thermoprotei archaeon]
MEIGSRSEDVKSLERFIEKLAETSDVDAKKALHVFKLISDPGNKNGLSDEDLEELTGYKQGEIRRILRVFYDARLAYYRKGKHPKLDTTRYYWRIDGDTANSALLRRKKEVLNKLKLKLEYELNNTFYTCPKDNSRYTFSEAYGPEGEFRCPRCGALLQPEDNSQLVESLEREIKRLEEEIAEDEKKLYSG